MLHFGRRPFAVPTGATYAHVSTDGRLYRKHQARHLGVWPPPSRLIRHDIYLQRIFGDVCTSLTELVPAARLKLADDAASA